jgi:hypothetical protein
MGRGDGQQKAQEGGNLLFGPRKPLAAKPLQLTKQQEMRLLASQDVEALIRDHIGDDGNNLLYFGSLEIHKGLTKTYSLSVNHRPDYNDCVWEIVSHFDRVGSSNEETGSVGMAKTLDECVDKIKVEFDRQTFIKGIPPTKSEILDALSERAASDY